MKKHPLLKMTLCAVAVAALMVGAPAHATGGHGGGNSHSDFSIETLSTRANTVSGGDVLVQVRLPHYARQKDLVIRLNGRDVSNAFVADGSRKLRALLTGLREGRNTVTVGAKHHHHQHVYEKLEITNYPSSGEIFGPHQRPWICETEASGLGAPPASGPCAAPTKYEWFYRTTAGTFQPLANPGGALPADLAQTTTIDGNTVNYIVRVESGVINESIYRIAILDNPANPISNPWSKNGKKPGAGWNGKLSWPFGGGAEPAFRSGRNVVTSALQDLPLSLGFAVAFGTRNTFGTGCGRHRVGRNADDDQGALHRAIRRAEVHDRQWRFRRRDPATPDQLQLPRLARRVDAGHPVPGRHLGRRRHHRLPHPEQLLQQDPESG